MVGRTTNFSLLDIIAFLILFCLYIFICIHSKVPACPIRIALIALSPIIPYIVATFITYRGSKELLFTLGIFMHRWGFYTFLPLASVLFLKKDEEHINRIIQMIIILTFLAVGLQIVDIYSRTYLSRAYAALIGPNAFAN